MGGPAPPRSSSRSARIPPCWVKLLLSSLCISRHTFSRYFCFWLNKLCRTVLPPTSSHRSCLTTKHRSWPSFPLSFSLEHSAPTKNFRICFWNSASCRVNWPLKSTRSWQFLIRRHCLCLISWNALATYDFCSHFVATGLHWQNSQLPPHESAPLKRLLDAWEAIPFCKQSHHGYTSWFRRSKWIFLPIHRVFRRIFLISSKPTLLY